jgi:thiol-disulfide isomerase/thioredoxin
MRFAAAILALVTAILPQGTPDGGDLLKQTGDAYNRLRSYQYELEMVTDITASGAPVRVTMTNSVAAVNPDKKRIETRSATSGARSTIVSDGSCTWFYNSVLNQYAKRLASQRFQPMDASFGLGQLPDSSRLFSGARTVRGQVIEAGGRKYECWLVEAKIDRFTMAQSPGMVLTDCSVSFWITKDRNIPMRTALSGKMQGSPISGPVEVHQEMKTTSLSVNADLPDALFRFTAPAGAKEVAEFDTPSLRKPDLAGKPAPAFRVQSLEGRIFDLSELRGKVILLDFWATWSEHCRQEMAVLGKLQQEYREGDLILLGLNVGEDRAVLESYLKKISIPYPVGLTNGTNLPFDFKVNALPTHVLIGRDGNIVAYEVGSVGSESLRSLLARAGLKPAADKGK